MEDPNNEKGCDCSGSPELTELGPITPDDKPQGYGSYFLQLFKRKNSKSQNAGVAPKYGEKKEDSKTMNGTGRITSPGETFEHSSSSNSLKTLINDLNATHKGKLSNLSNMEEVSHERTLPNVLTRIKNIIDNKGTSLQQYKDSDFRHYWLPDHLSKECYDCSEKFTPLRRRHHCRVCGQIFCSKCCNRMIPGKIIGYKGELRVCTYCCKVILTYLQSNNIEEEVLADLRALQEELLPPKPSLKSADMESGTVSDSDWQSTSNVRRKPVFGFMEENYAVKCRYFSSDYVDQKQLEQMSSERQLLLKDTQQLHLLWSEMVMGQRRLQITTNRHRLKAFPDSFIGRDFVQWLLDNDKASSRQSAIAIGQALLEADYIFCVSQSHQIFVDEHVLYTTLKPAEYEIPTPMSSSLTSSQDQEPLWLKQIPSQVEDAKEDSSVMKFGNVDISMSSSTYSLDMNFRDSVVSVRNQHQKRDLMRASKGPFGCDVGDNLQTSVSAVLNDSILSTDSEQHSTSTVLTEEVLEALKTLEPKEAEARAAGWQHLNQLTETEETTEGQLDEQTKMSLSMQKKFNTIWNCHENALLTQLLRSTNLDLCWAKTMIPLIYTVVDTVRPDVKNEADDMDIRQYVQFKKVPGGSGSECRIINGTVCTKNVVHRQMKTRLCDPQILLIASFIDYHRSAKDSKDSSMDNLLLQEEEYIKKVVARILSLNPSIVITGEGISFLAREYLMAEGITLITNVKTSVLERIARCTQAQIIPSVDSEAILGEMGLRALGMCHSFYLRPFTVPGAAPTQKTLMFFDGCATHLGCTVILRGAPNRELKKVKRVMYFMIFALFNWRLERSFLMDEFASVPPAVAGQEGEEEGGIRGRGSQERVTDEQNSEEFTTPPSGEEEEGEPPPVAPSESLIVPEANAVVDHSDPLCAFLRRGSTYGDAPLARRESESLPCGDPSSPSFASALEGTVLAISPYIHYSIPYLESSEGSNSPLRRFFPQKLYFSSRFCTNTAAKAVGGGFPSPAKAERARLACRPPHAFVTSKITKGINDLALRSALADFRARGGTIHTLCLCQSNGVKRGRFEEIFSRSAEDDVDSEIEKKESYNNFILTSEGKIDALHPYNHQRISLLFFSFSHTFQYTSVFCVNPRVLTMDFYGRNDIPLGAFLERYCFSPSYRCLSDACQTPSLRHVRKFVHENGCVEILLRKMDTSLDESNSSAVYMWTWCKECREVSPVVPMSSDTWLFSFAKYLEIRFRETAISRRGTPGCSHSIHQDHFHYFGQKDLVAVVKYLVIATRELVIPPTEIEYVLNPATQSSIVEMIKTIAIQGFNVFSTIVDRLSTISDEIGQRWDPLLKDVASHHHHQKQVFRESIENIQLQLTCPSLEERLQDPSSPCSCQETTAILFGISDQVTIIKRLIAQVVLDWNSKVQDLMNLRKKDEKERLRNNSGNILKQSSVTQVSVTSASGGSGSAEQLSNSCKGSEESSSTAQSSSQTTSSEQSFDTTPEGEKPQTSSAEEQRKYVTSVTKGVGSTQANGPIGSEGDVEGSMSGHHSLVVMAQALMEDKIGILKLLEEVSLPHPMTTPGLAPFSSDAATVDVESAPANSSVPVATVELDKTVESGPEGVPSSSSAQSDQSSRRKQTSCASDGSGSSSLRPVTQPVKSSPKSYHERSFSDEGEVFLAREALEKVPEKRYSSSVKNIISTLWSSSADLMVKSPFDPTEHFSLLPEVKIPVIIYEDEPSSMIAKALASQEYETQLQALQKRLSDSPQGQGAQNAARVMENEGASASFAADLCGSQEGGSGVSTPKVSEGEKSSQKDLHIELQWSDQHTNYYCKILFVEQFRKLRQLVFPFGEEFFVRSLSRCVIWDARGGKSGSFFCKTTDDRFILKEMSRFEISSFIEFAPAYIQYVTGCKKENKPTALTRIVGVYRIGFKNSITNKALKLDLLVMENLFYQRSIGPKFDLKGSVRNRKVNITGKEESEVVLLDENLLQMVCSSPFYLRPHGKAVLTRAIAADSAFLAHQLVMDYSLLVGIDETNNQLIVGIIDYIRTFTWDKKLETIFKGSVLGAGTGKLPTVISPELYRNRFCHAMESYFVVAPDRWSGLGLSFDS